MITISLRMVVPSVSAVFRFAVSLFYRFGTALVLFRFPLSVLPLWPERRFEQYVYIYIHIDILVLVIHVCTYIYIYTHICMYLSLYIQIYIYIYIYICIYRERYIQICVYIYIYVHTCITNTNISICIYIYTYCSKRRSGQSGKTESGKRKRTSAVPKR